MKFWDGISVKTIVTLGVATMVTVHFSAALFGLYRQEQGLERIEAAVRQSKENETLIRDVRDIGRIVVAVTGCTPEDTQEKCQDKLKAKSIEEGNRRVAAVHCIVRSVDEGDTQTTTEQRCN